MVVFQERNERSSKRQRVSQREQLERWNLKESSENVNENKTKKKATETLLACNELSIQGGIRMACERTAQQ